MERKYNSKATRARGLVQSYINGNYSHLQIAIVKKGMCIHSSVMNNISEIEQFSHMAQTIGLNNGLSQKTQIKENVSKEMKIKKTKEKAKKKKGRGRDMGEKSHRHWY